MNQRGGYEDGYESCECFWGQSPATGVRRLRELLGDAPSRVLDLGCGEGKNAAFLAGLGHHVVGVEISMKALDNARNAWPSSKALWLNADIVGISAPARSYDAVVATGSLHCLENREEVQMVIDRMKAMTAAGGFNVLSAFNDRAHDLSGHPRSFSPCLLPHLWYTEQYEGWRLIHESDEDLEDLHPHNRVPHRHSVSRIVAQRIDL